MPAVNEKPNILYRFLCFQILKNLKKFEVQSVGAGTKFLKPRMINDMQIVLTMEALYIETQRLESIYQQKLAALDELKKLLLDQAFSGRL